MKPLNLRDQTEYDRQVRRLKRQLAKPRAKAFLAARGLDRDTVVETLDKLNIYDGTQTENEASLCGIMIAECKTPLNQFI